MTNTFPSTIVVSCVARGNWDVTDNNGTGNDGFKNWTAAEASARETAVALNAIVIRLSAKDKRVVAFIKPRATVPAAMVRANKVEAVVAPTFVDADETEALPTEAELNDLPTAALVAAYNAVGGSITGKFKGARKMLVSKILTAQAA